MGVKLKGNIRIKTTKKTGDFLVRFFDYDGTILKEQWVYSGETATAPPIPTHQYLTFAEWNNTFDNVTEDIDTGAIYNTTDGNTYLFMYFATGNTVTTLYFVKNSTSLMTIYWGDGTTSTSTTIGVQNIAHTYTNAGNYNIIIESLGGNYVFGDNNATTKSILGASNNNCLKMYIGNTTYLNNYYGFLGITSLKSVTLGTNHTALGFKCFNILYGSLKHLNIPKITTIASSFAQGNPGIRKIILPKTITSIGQEFVWIATSLEYLVMPPNITVYGSNFFNNCNSLKYIIFKNLIPPTITTTTFMQASNITHKIYVPDSVVDVYKTTTNWTLYVNVIFPVSDYYNNRY